MTLSLSLFFRRRGGNYRKRAPQRGAGSKHGVTKNQSNDAPSKPASESEAASVAESRPPGLTVLENILSTLIRTFSTENGYWIVQNHPKNVQASAAPGTYAAILSQNTPVTIEFSKYTADDRSILMSRRTCKKILLLCHVLQ